MNNKKTKYLFFLPAFLFVFNANAQKNVLSNEQNTFLKNNVTKAYLKNKGYYFLKIPKEKEYKSRISGEVIIKDTGDVDIFNINVDFNENDFQYYFVKNHNLLLVLKSIDFLKKEIENEY